jgi:hypothetical protein
MIPVNNFPCFSIYMVQNSGSLNISTLKGQSSGLGPIPTQALAGINCKCR